MEPNGILIYGELQKDYSIAPVVLELITKARELRTKIWNQKISVCVIGPRINYDNITKELGEYGADNIIIVSDDRLKNYDKDYHTYLFVKIAKKYLARIILIGATTQGKEIASFTATKLETGLTADCTNLDIDENYNLLSTRPTFGGKLTADIHCKTDPQMATVQQNVFKAEKTQNNANVIFDWLNIDEFEKRIETIKTIKKSKSFRDINTAQIIVAGGAGACNDNGFTLIYELAQRLNAAVAGSRGAYEKGFIVKSQQIGQTGKTVAPKLYIAVGISGALQHIEGIKNAEKIIAINNDENAPIFKQSDIGIVGNLFEIIPEIINELDKKEEKNE